MRKLWTEERVSFEGDYYRTVDATVYDKPEQPVPVYVAAGGPLVARYAGRSGDGFICTSGKGEELYRDKLLPAVDEGLAKSGRTREDIDRMIEIKLSWDPDREHAVANCRFWAPLSLTAEQKHGTSDPLEMERLGDALPTSRSPPGGSSPMTPKRSSRPSSPTSTGVSTTWSSTDRATTRRGS